MDGCMCWLYHDIFLLTIFLHKCCKTAFGKTKVLWIILMPQGLFINAFALCKTPWMLRAWQIKHQGFLCSVSSSTLVSTCCNAAKHVIVRSFLGSYFCQMNKLLDNQSWSMFVLGLVKSVKIELIAFVVVDCKEGINTAVRKGINLFLLLLPRYLVLLIVVKTG
jgi:hypothetical protein